MINKYDKNSCLYILESKSGRYSVLSEFKIDELTRKFDINLVKAQLETKEKLLFELNRRIPVYNMNIDSVEYKYSLFGGAKL